MKKTKALKNIVCIIILLFIAMDTIGCSMTTHASDNYHRAKEITVAADAKKLLIEGNERYVSGEVLNDDLSDSKREDLVANGQHPFAVIVSCSDSRVPPEIIFDQALGDIFIIRNAGNIIDDVTLGSVEYGAEHAKAPLVVVLGHEGCGAVKATVDGGKPEGSIASIVEKITPSLDKVKSETTDKKELYTKCEDENIKNSINEINKSEVIKKLVEEKKVEVVGAKYDLNTGKVEFYN